MHLFGIMITLFGDEEIRFEVIYQLMSSVSTVFIYLFIYFNKMNKISILKKNTDRPKAHAVMNLVCCSICVLKNCQVTTLQLCVF